MKVTYGGDFGGPETTEPVLPGYLAIKSELVARMAGDYCPTVDEIGLVLRVAGSITQFDPTGVSRIRRDHRRRVISADVNLNPEDWEGRSQDEVLKVLVILTELALKGVVERLQRDKVPFKEREFFDVWDSIRSGLLGS